MPLDPFASGILTGLGKVATEKLAVLLSSQESMLIKNLLVQIKSHEALYVNMEMEYCGKVVTSIVWFERFLTEEMKKLDTGSWLLAPYASMADRAREFLQAAASIQREGKKRQGGTFNIYDESLDLSDVVPVGLQWRFAAALGSLRGRVGEQVGFVLGASEMKVPDYLQPLVLKNENADLDREYALIIGEVIKKNLRH